MSTQSIGLDGVIAPLPVGTQAPDFTLPQVVQLGNALQAQHGGKLRLHHVGHRQLLVLALYPMDWEPVSREQLTLYQEYADTFEQLGARLLGISVDHVYCHAAFARDAHLDFPLLADFQLRRRVSQRYGGYRVAQGVSARALFVLDARGVIRFSKAYPDALDPGVDELLTTLEASASNRW